MTVSTEALGRPELISANERARIQALIRLATVVPPDPVDVDMEDWRTSAHFAGSLLRLLNRESRDPAKRDADGGRPPTLDAGGLLRLLDSAAVGHRVFELLSLNRWCNLEPYLVHTSDRLTSDVAAVPIFLPEFAALELFATVKTAHQRLRTTEDPLTRAEIQRFDDGSHWRFALHDPCWPNALHVPEPTSKLPPSLVHFIVDTIQRPDIGSVSCDQDDYALWRLLVQEQVRRAGGQQAPQEVFGLSGPDSGLTFVEPRDWGGEIHIPYEGMMEGDLLFLPKWRRFGLESAVKYGRLRSGVGKHCKVVISERDFGDIGGIERTTFGPWVVYTEPGQSAPVNPWRPGYGRT